MPAGQDTDAHTRVNATTRTRMLAHAMAASAARGACDGAARACTPRKSVPRKATIQSTKSDFLTVHR